MQHPFCFELRAVFNTLRIIFFLVVCGGTGIAGFLLRGVSICFVFALSICSIWDVYVNRDKLSDDGIWLRDFKNIAL